MLLECLILILKTLASPRGGNTALACVGVLVDIEDVLPLLIYEWLLEHVPHHVLLHSCSAITEYAS
jgi:hypothetical protein